MCLKYKFLTNTTFRIQMLVHKLWYAAIEHLNKSKWCTKSCNRIVTPLASNSLCHAYVWVVVVIVVLETVVVVVDGCKCWGAQRIEPVVTMHCRGHRMMTMSNTIRKIKSNSRFQSISRSKNPSLGRVWGEETTPCPLAPMSMQIQKACMPGLPMGCW